MKISQDPIELCEGNILYFVIGDQLAFSKRFNLMKLHPLPLYSPIPVKALIPKSIGTRSQRINPWISADEPAATICKNVAGHELKEAQIKPTCQSYRVLTGQEPKKDFGLVRLDPEKPCPTIQRSSPQSITTGLIHPSKSDI